MRAVSPQKRVTYEDVQFWLVHSLTAAMNFTPDIPGTRIDKEEFGILATANLRTLAVEIEQGRRQGLSENELRGLVSGEILLALYDAIDQCSGVDERLVPRYLKLLARDTTTLARESLERVYRTALKKENP